MSDQLASAPQPLPICLCGCGKPIRAAAHLRGVKKFASDACRMRWHSARRKRALELLSKQGSGQ